MRIGRTHIILSVGMTMIIAKPGMADTGQQSVVVHTADLNLANKDGQLSLQRRVAHAVKSVCGDADIRNLIAMKEMSACRSIAMSGAKPQMELAIANARRGRSLASNDVRIVAPES